MKEHTCKIPIDIYKKHLILHKCLHDKIINKTQLCIFSVTVMTPTVLPISSSSVSEDGVKHWKEVPLRAESTTGMIISLPLFDGLVQTNINFNSGWPFSKLCKHNNII